MNEANWKIFEDTQVHVGVRQIDHRQTQSLGDGGHAVFLAHKAHLDRRAVNPAAAGLCLAGQLQLALVDKALLKKNLTGNHREMFLSIRAGSADAVTDLSRSN